MSNSAFTATLPPISQTLLLNKTSHIMNIGDSHAD
jgi:hypothetical protein